MQNALDAEENVYNEFAVPTVINAVGEQTRVSGTLMRDEAAEAMRRASNHYVSMEELQGRASEIIADLTGAEAGYVTSGAAAGLALSAAACIAGRDYKIMNQLPDTDGIPSEILIPRSHRTRYEVGLRVSGATLRGIGLNDLSSQFLEDYKSWEFDMNITDETVAAVYTAKPYNQLPLEEFAETAHANDIPVIVDAAAELPPVENFRTFVEKGADIVLFSGGKAIRGPQTTGIVAGRKDLIESIALQHVPCGTHEGLWNPPDSIFTSEPLPGVPRPGIGRAMKVGKEEIVGLLKSLELFVEEDHDERIEEWNRITASIEEQLRDEKRLDITTKISRSVNVIVARLTEHADMSVKDLVLALRDENPRVFVDGRYYDNGYFVINPRSLSPSDADYLVSRIQANLE